ncbi:hypothetical protein B5807_08598 [Epicoccum nigrum]|uniref:Uncharacterized protein n=1 Tax=Epicoccum nigrum TaxID=105696 RepID=A0A1Y2LR06_EPING|nr:hypothetical protein B5807_08598 [Epicoccum nigrum]
MRMISRTLNCKWQSTTLFRKTQGKNILMSIYIGKGIMLTNRKKIYTGNPPFLSTSITHLQKPKSLYEALHLRVQEVAILVHILDGLLGGAVALLVPGHLGREAAAAGVRGGGLGLACVLGEGDVDGGRCVGEGLAGGLVLGGLGQDLVRGGEVGQLVVGRGGHGLVALCAHVEVGDVVRVQLALDADNLVVQVLGQVRLDVIRVQRLELAGGLFALKAGGQGKSALGDHGVGAVAVALHCATEDAVGTDVVGILGVVGGCVVVSLAAGAVGVGSSRVGHGVRGSRVGGRIGGRVRAGLADEAVDSVGSLHGVLVGSNGEDVVVVTLLDRAALVLTSLGRGLVVSTLVQGTLASTIELADSAGNL